MNDPATTFEDWKLVFLSPWGTAGIVLAALAMVAALVITARSFNRQPRWSIRALLVALRFLSLAALMAIVLQPAIQLRNITRVPNHVIVLLDISSSMAIREKKGAPSRLERSRALLARSAKRIAGWARERIVTHYSFGETLKVFNPTAAGLRADENATQIRNALSRLRQKYEGKDLAAVILISDGIDNGQLGVGRLSSGARQFLKNLPAPVHTVWVGRAGIRDLAISEVYADDFAFVRNAVQVEAELIVNGIDLDRLPVTLETGGEIVAQREIVLSPNRRRYRVRFEFVPQKVGKYFYTIRTPVLAGEALAGNNRRSFVIKVIRDRIRVLQVCGRPSWDERFLRRLLKRDPNIDLISFFILRTPTDLTMVPNSEMSLIPFPTEELFERELGSFDLVLLQNFNYRPYGIGAYLPHLARFVKQGGGLAMLGGDLSFSSGRYHGTGLSRLLPVRLLPADRGLARLYSDEEFRIRVTREGHDHPILQIGATRRATQQLLASLPALAGMNLVGAARRGGTTLAVHPFLKLRDGKPMPVLAVREAGKGRTMTLTTDSSWHWAFHSVGAGGTRQAYDRFWRNTIRWLIRDPDLKHLRVILRKDRIPLGRSLQVVIRGYNADYSPATGLRVAYKFSPLPRGKGRVRHGKTNSSGELALTVSPPAVGAYRLRATAVIDGRRSQEDALVLVEPAGPEDREPQATPALLEKISRLTGGRHLGRAASLPDLKFRDSRQVRINWRKDLEIWNRWWTLLACVALLGLEWLVRRRFGYL